ncbi:unnamed protein product [Calypogeia fissa]
MNTPDVENSSRSQSTSDDFSLFRSVIFGPPPSELPSVELVFKVAAAANGSLQNSYKFVTESAIDSSTQDTSQSTASSSRTATFRKESLGIGNPRSNDNDAWSDDGASPIVSRSYSSLRLGPARVRSFSRLGRTNRVLKVGKNEDHGAVQPTTGEVWGWLLCEVGMSGFKALLWVFFPLLVFSLFAGTKGFLAQGTSDAVADTIHCPYNRTDRDPRCLKVCDSFTEDLTDWTSGSLGGNETRSSGVTILEILSARSWQPAVLFTVMLGISVVLQVGLFTITSPLLDYGKYQSFLLWVGAGTGVVASAITINLFRVEWWWIGGILFLFSTVGVGLVSTWLDSYLSSLARGIPILKTQLFDEVQIFQSVRVRFAYKGSLTGVIFGYLSALLCTLCAFFFLQSPLVPKLMGIHPNNWSLRIACLIGGLWWLGWTVISSAFLIKDRPGPSLRSIPHPAAKHLQMAIFKMSFGPSEKGRSALLLLLVCFLSSMGNATVFQSGILCFSPRNFIKFALLSQLSSLIGTLLFFLVQIALSWSSKLMLLIALLLHLLIPIYACIGFFYTTTSRKKSKLLGLNREWELVVFAFAYGICLGAHRSYIRALFLACIPSPTLAGAYFSLLALVSQFSTFIGSVEVFLFVRYNGDLRYTFVVMAVALLLASLLMVLYIGISNQQDFDVVSATDVSVQYEDHQASLTKSTVEQGSENSDSSVYVPMTLRAQFSPVKS